MNVHGQAKNTDIIKSCGWMDTDIDRKVEVLVALGIAEPVEYLRSLLAAYKNNVNAATNAYFEHGNLLKPSLDIIAGENTSKKRTLSFFSNGTTIDRNRDQQSSKSAAALKSHNKCDNHKFLLGRRIVMGYSLSKGTVQRNQVVNISVEGQSQHDITAILDPSLSSIKNSKKGGNLTKKIFKSIPNLLFRCQSAPDSNPRANEEPIKGRLPQWLSSFLVPLLTEKLVTLCCFIPYDRGRVEVFNDLPVFIIIYADIKFFEIPTSDRGITENTVRISSSIGYNDPVLLASCASDLLLWIQEGEDGYLKLKAREKSELAVTVPLQPSIEPKVADGNSLAPNSSKLNGFVDQSSVCDRSSVYLASDIDQEVQACLNNENNDESEQRSFLDSELYSSNSVDLVSQPEQLEDGIILKRYQLEAMSWMINRESLCDTLNHEIESNVVGIANVDPLFESSKRKKLDTENSQCRSKKTEVVVPFEGLPTFIADATSEDLILHPLWQQCIAFNCITLGNKWESVYRSRQFQYELRSDGITSGRIISAKEEENSAACCDNSLDINLPVDSVKYFWLVLTF